jgi:hypothetical protein
MTQQELELASQVLLDAYQKFNEQDAATQTFLRGAVPAFANALQLAERSIRDFVNSERRARLQTAKQRKTYRDQVIPVWCIENLKPGMLIKVKAANSTMRKVEAVNKYSVTGRHCHYSRLRNLDTREFEVRLVEDGYITQHVLTNVTGIVTGADSRGKPVVVSIMEYVEGRAQL